MVAVIAQPTKWDSELSFGCMLFKSINLLKNENPRTSISRTICFKIAMNKCLNNNLFYITSEFMFNDVLIYFLGHNESRILW